MITTPFLMPIRYLFCMSVEEKFVSFVATTAMKQRSLAVGLL